MKTTAARLTEMLDAFPADEVVTCCRLIFEADEEALASDGCVPATAMVLTKAELQRCLSALWQCRNAANIALELQDRGHAAARGEWR